MKKKHWCLQYLIDNGLPPFAENSLEKLAEALFDWPSDRAAAAVHGCEVKVLCVVGTPKNERLEHSIGHGGCGPAERVGGDYDIYLKSAIVTPWGTTNHFAADGFAGGLTFFTPQLSPEPAGTQGNAQAYNYYPIKRDTIKSMPSFRRTSC